MIKTIVRLIAAAALLHSIALAAFTPNEKQRNAIEHISQVIAGSRVCDDWALNEKFAAQIQLILGFFVTEPDTFDYVDGRVRFHQDRIAGRTRADICAAMERHYGPEGEAVPNLAWRVRQ